MGEWVGHKSTIWVVPRPRYTLTWGEPANMQHGQVQLWGWRGAGAGQPLFPLSPNKGSVFLGCTHHLQCLSQLRKQEAKGDVTEKRTVEQIALRGRKSELHKRTNGRKEGKRNKE